MTGFRNTVASSVAFRDIAERKRRPVVPQRARDVRVAPPQYSPPLFTADGANNYVGCRDATDLRSYTLLAEPSGQAVVDPQGILAYTLRDAHHHVVRHFGACVFEPEQDNRRVADAIAYIKAVGCRLGQPDRDPAGAGRVPAPRPGAVYGYYVHGGQAVLVPRGTAIDIIVNRKPSEST